MKINKTISRVVNGVSVEVIIQPNSNFITEGDDRFIAIDSSGNTYSSDEEEYIEYLLTLSTVTEQERKLKDRELYSEYFKEASEVIAAFYKVLKTKPYGRVEKKVKFCNQEVLLQKKFLSKGVYRYCCISIQLTNKEPLQYTIWSNELPKHDISLPKDLKVQILSYLGVKTRNE